MTRDAILPPGRTGYAHPCYAHALSEFGEPVALRASGGWLLKRPVGLTGSSDACGPYPLFCCEDWNALRSDLDSLPKELVSAVVVANPFGRYSETLLRDTFDTVMPFKTHFVVDLDQPGPYGTRHHRRWARRAFRHVAVEVCHPTEVLLAEWTGLYSCLVERHAIMGIQAFSPESFRRQFCIPGLVCLQALASGGECVGAQLWYVQGDVAYSHLVAVNEHGYRSGCSFALHSAAFEFFHGKVRWLNLGGAAGSRNEPDGLAAFKQGWSNTTRTAFLCGRILNPKRYRELAALARAQNAGYFPAYRWRDAA
jgi:hypothetical protein